ncbi:MAG: rhamnulokinase, partial [Oscillospiraceae bacterium]|nr:rhamnulokinase [Oscillospiraceae bacterium]
MNFKVIDMNYYLAVDIGASSGRHILCHVENGQLVTEEIHRFPNGAEPNENGTLCWNVKRLFSEIVTGMKKCHEIGKIPVSMGIDTWGVDFVLTDGSGNVIGDSASYRDKRTDNVKISISDRELYSRTGIQKQKFNTIYQLAYLKENYPEQLEAAEHMLMLPDYFNFLLTGQVMQEYTNATTTGLVNAEKCDWDYEIISALGLPREIFTEISMSGSLVGRLKGEIAETVGFDTNVILTASHDTASAVMAVPSNRDDIIYISSGTWSLMGVEADTPDCSPESAMHNFTNEGGYDRRYRYLKNIMGLWIIQQLRHELDDKYSFAELCDMAENSDIDTLIDCSDDMFLSPKSMKSAIEAYCENHKLAKPVTTGEFARVIYRSLALCYKN